WGWFPEFLIGHHTQKTELRLEDEVSKLLDREQLADDLKVKLLSQLLIRYQNMVREPSGPVRVSIVDENEHPRAVASQRWLQVIQKLARFQPRQRIFATPYWQTILYPHAGKTILLTVTTDPETNTLSTPDNTPYPITFHSLHTGEQFFSHILALATYWHEPVTSDPNTSTVTTDPETSTLSTQTTHLTQ
ncbi:uncharacterized protein TNCV_4683741, partial [Trichonephila clavipes]